MCTTNASGLLSRRACHTSPLPHHIMNIPYETPARVWRRIQEGEEHGEDMPSLPSFPGFEDSMSEKSSLSLSASSNGILEEIKVRGQFFLYLGLLTVITASITTRISQRYLSETYATTPKKPSTVTLNDRVIPLRLLLEFNSGKSRHLI